MIHDPERVAARMARLASTGEIEAIDGSTVRLTAQSICVHGDSPGAVQIARAVRERRKRTASPSAPSSRTARGGPMNASATKAEALAEAGRAARARYPRGPRPADGRRRAGLTQANMIALPRDWPSTSCSTPSATRRAAPSSTSRTPARGRRCWPKGLTSRATFRSIHLARRRPAGGRGAGRLRRHRGGRRPRHLPDRLLLHLRGAAAGGRHRGAPHRGRLERADVPDQPAPAARPGGSRARSSSPCGRFRPTGWPTRRSSAGAFLPSTARPSMSATQQARHRGSRQADFGDAVRIEPGEIPSSGPAGVTPQAAVMASRVPFAVTHAPGHMFVTDIPDAAYHV